jgi:PadR family transcriptional regulator PadR
MKMFSNQKEVQAKLTKGLLDMIILQFLNEQPMHGYEVITKIRKSLGVYFGPSTIYPLLASLEKKGQVTSVWNMESERPRKVYKLTNEGQDLLSCTEKSLNLIFRAIGANHEPKTTNETAQVGITTVFHPGKTRAPPVFMQ